MDDYYAMADVSIANLTLAGQFDVQYDPWFEFEKHFPHKPIRSWFQRNRHLVFFIAAGYIVMTFAGRKVMANRQKFDLRRPLFAWNVFMALFSFFFVVRIGPPTIHRLFYNTLYGIICDSSKEPTVPHLIMWGDVFAITKVIEFVDTIFIILRKQHLGFIHWYHHSTVVIVCWYCLGAIRGPPNCVNFIAMNSLVHTFMYTYYAFKSLKFEIPKYVNICLTLMQISQMLVGVAINSLAAYYMFAREDTPCDDDPKQIMVSFAVYSTYIYLFCEFFYKAYVHRGDSSKLSNFVKKVN